MPLDTPQTLPKQPLNAPPIPSKALTLSRKVDECKPLAAGMDAFMQKPVQKAELLAMIDTFIRPSVDGSDRSLEGTPRAADGDGTSFDGSGGAVWDSVTDVSPAAFRVLLAEDSRANQLAISRLLSAQGVDVTVVNDGSAAVVKLVGERAVFDLAFFDINMPIMGGVEALHRVRAAGNDMPIIALTASVARDELRGCLDAGFTDVTSKPLQRQLCRDILAQHGHTLPPEKSKSQPRAIAVPVPAPAPVVPVAADRPAEAAAGDGATRVLVVDHNAEEVCAASKHARRASEHAHA